MSSYWYLATPYTKYPWGLDAAFTRACGVAAKFLDEGIPIYSPIAHSHSIADFTKAAKTDSSYWVRFHHEMMVAARGLIVAKMDGWDVSDGVKDEITYFLSQGKPIIYADPDNIAAAIELIRCQITS